MPERRFVVVQSTCPPLYVKRSTVLAAYPIRVRKRCVQYFCSSEPFCRLRLSAESFIFYRDSWCLDGAWAGVMRNAADRSGDRRWDQIRRGHKASKHLSYADAKDRYVQTVECRFCVNGGDKHRTTFYDSTGGGIHPVICVDICRKTEIVLTLRILDPREAPAG